MTALTSAYLRGWGPGGGPKGARDLLLFGIAFTPNARKIKYTFSCDPKAQITHKQTRVPFCFKAILNLPGTHSLLGFPRESYGTLRAA